jgi:acetolactate synthase I/II/III large subunit
MSFFLPDSKRRLISRMFVTHFLKEELCKMPCRTPTVGQGRLLSEQLPFQSSQKHAKDDSHMQTVAAILAKQLKEWGVTHAFGIPGKAVVPLILAADNEGISFVLSKHEGAAGYEAAGYSLMSKKIGVAIGTSGPGATNLLTAAAQAKASNIPMLIFTGHPAVKAAGQPLSQDSSPFGTDVTDMFASVTKYSARIERPDLAEPIFRHAVEEAFRGVKGPVHLSIPADVLVDQTEPFAFPLPEEEPLLSSRLDEAAGQIQRAERPLLLLGKGIHSARAYKEVEQFAEKFQIPVITTPGGKGTFLSRHPLSLGAFGLGGTDAAHDYVENGVDTLIVCGSSLSDMSIPGWKKEDYPEQVIHFDLNASFVGRAISVPTLPVIGDLKANLSYLLQKTEYLEDAGRRQPAFSGEEAASADAPESPTGKWLSSVDAVKTINYMLPEDTTLFGDDGSHTFYAVKHYEIKKHGGFYFDDVFGAMGHGIGYAVGAKTAAPDQNVACLTGDGCLFMHGAEIGTAVESGAGVLFIVLNNQALDMVDKGMKVHLGRSIGTRYSSPLKVKEFASSLGADAVTVRSAEELEQALTGAFPLSHPYVIEVVVDPEEIPPTMRRG